MMKPWGFVCCYSGPGTRTNGAFSMALVVSLMAAISYGMSAAVITSIDRRPPRLVRHPVSRSKPGTNITILANVLPDGGHRAYLTISSDVWSVRIPEHGLKRTSQQAVGCGVVSNGGPFQGNGEPVGPVIIDSKIVYSDFPEEAVGFGRTSANEWVLGTLKDESEVGALQIQFFLGGFNWLVYNGSTAVPDVNPTGAVRSPRTTIGVTVDGLLCMVLVDGCEKCFRQKGLTLQELATLLVDLGVLHAINLDGGSSSTLVVNNKVINHPTCLDISLKCERPVATVTCLHHADYASLERL